MSAVTVSTVLAALAESEQHYAAAVDALTDMAESLAIVKEHLHEMQRQDRTNARAPATPAERKDWRRIAKEAIR